jgi:ribosomal 50S subunit-associated protein YjgA (DUF615 family)
MLLELIGKAKTVIWRMLQVLQYLVEHLVHVAHDDLGLLPLGREGQPAILHQRVHLHIKRHGNDGDK